MRKREREKTMDKHISNLMKETGFLPEAHDFFVTLYNSLKDSGIAFFEELRKEYFIDNDEANKSVNEKLELYAKEKGVNTYSIQMLFLLYCSKHLQEKYIDNGYNYDLYIDIMKDLWYKTNVCKKVHGVWGTFSFEWFHWHFLCKRFALGCFQYEIEGFKNDIYTCGNITVNKGDKVYNFHIPETGSISKSDRIESYKKAFNFYGFKKGEKMILVCHSWLIYPENDKIYSKSSNLYSFMEDFDIINKNEYENAFPDSWRVFDQNYQGTTESFPKITSLQRSIAQWLDAGRKIGEGYGIIIFDGEKIVNI